MTPELLLGASLRALRGAPASAAELCRALIPRLPPDSVVVAATAAGSALDRGLGACVAAESLFRHRVFSSGESLAQAEDGIAESLSDRNRDVAEGSLSPWPGGRLRAPRRLRRIDTLYAETCRVGLIAIEDAAAAGPVLAGARRVLEGDPPAVVLDFAGVPLDARVGVWEALVTLLAPFALDWHDAMLRPADGPARRREALIVLADQAVCALPAALAARALPSLIAREVPAEDAALAALAWSGWASPLEPRARGELVVDFDADLACRGFHPAETDGRMSWRWSGPGRRAAIVLPQPGRGGWRLRFDVLDWGVADHAGSMQVFCGGTRLRETYRDAFGARFEGISVQGPEFEGGLTIELVTPKPRRASSEDARLIGVNCLRATLERIR